MARAAVMSADDNKLNSHPPVPLRREAFLDGRHLRAARAFAGMTQAGLALSAGLHPNSIKYWERQNDIGLVEGGAIEAIIAALLARGVVVEIECFSNRHRAIVQTCTSRQDPRTSWFHRQPPDLNHQSE